MMMMVILMTMLFMKGHAILIINAGMYMWTMMQNH